MENNGSQAAAAVHAGEMHALRGTDSPERLTQGSEVPARGSTVSFLAVGDDRKTYTVNVNRRYLTMPMQDGGGGEVVGLQELRTREGWRVTRLDRGLYKILATDVVLRSTSPLAP